MKRTARTLITVALMICAFLIAPPVGSEADLGQDLDAGGVRDFVLMLDSIPQRLASFPEVARGSD